MEKSILDKQAYSKREFLLPALSLFTSGGTLICCALPALFVTIGAGAALAGLTSAFPALIWISQYKLWVFAAAAIILTLAGYWQWKARYLPCPTDPKLARACIRLRRISLYIYCISIFIFMLGAFFAFIAPTLL